MKRGICLTLMAVFALLSFSIVSTADVITLKNGTVVEGEIVEETDELFAIETEKGTGFYSKENIKSVNKTRLDVASGRIAEVTGTVAKPNSRVKPLPVVTDLLRGMFGGRARDRRAKKIEEEHQDVKDTEEREGKSIK